MYLRYIHLRIVHRKFFLNDLLHKVGIKKSPLCTLCKGSTDNKDQFLSPNVEEL